MKTTDYRIPWGRPSEHILAMKREIVGHQMHVQRVKDAKNRGMIDMEPPDCVCMPHMINRLKKKKKREEIILTRTVTDGAPPIVQLQEDRQREIAAENYSLMHRLAGIMKEDRIDPVQKFSHLSVKYRESLRKKKALKLQAENLRLARALKSQKPFYNAAKMDRDEGKRQALLSTMSRSYRRKERTAAFAAASYFGHSSTSPAFLKTKAATETAALMEDGILFRPGPTTVTLKTARQMKLEVAKRRLSGGAQEEAICGSSTEDGVCPRAGEAPSDGGGGRGSTCSTVDSITVERRAYSIGDVPAHVGSFERTGIALEMNRTGGGRQRKSGRGGRRSGAGGGRPKIIFTPSVVPVGMESVRTSPLSLGAVGPMNALGDGSLVGGAMTAAESPESRTKVGGEEALREG